MSDLKELKERVKGIFDVIDASPEVRYRDDGVERVKIVGSIVNLTITGDKRKFTVEGMISEDRDDIYREMESISEVADFIREEVYPQY